MNGKTVVVTGSTSGIGLEAADALAQKGAKLVLVGRDPMRGRDAVDRISQSGPAPYLVVADLSRRSEVERAAAEIMAATPRIDVLVNNAGALFTTRSLTEDGVEQTFALNHMAYFLLTNLLLERIVASAPSRIVSVASNAHRAGELDFDDLLHENDYEGWAAYSRSKLANILFTRALARRLAGTGVTANCLHPGLVRSRFFETLGGWAAMEAANPGAVGVSPTQGAATIVYLASSTDVEGVSGEYFYECEIASVTDAASDDQAAERLWTESLRLAALESIQDFSALAPESRARGGHR